MAYNKVYLIGFMGSGKSTTGKKLAASIGWSFIDMDAEIRKKAGKAIPQIFSENGESYFRELENTILRELESAENVIVSTGGGAPCHSENMAFMIKTGLTVYLKLTPQQLKGRLSDGKNERPLISGLRGNSLLVFIEDKLRQREPVYARAEITVDGFSIDFKNLLELIKEKI